MNRTLDVATSVAATLTRLPSGLSVGTLGKRPEQPLQLYEFEGCPFCRKVREALTDPRPRGRRAAVSQGRAALPPGGRAPRRQGPVPLPRRSEHGQGDVRVRRDRPLPVRRVRRRARALAPRRGRADDGDRRASRAWCGPGAAPTTGRPRAPEKPLELWSFEASPFCRIARETLCSLELPYRLHNVGKGSPSRDAFVARSGRMMVPFLVDPNTGVEMFESADIVAYLERTYAEA